MDIYSPFSIFKNIGTLPQGHEKPLKHALYNALALLILFLSCAASYALYLILEPFIKPLIWAVLVGSVLHPMKSSLAKIFRNWFTTIDESNTPLILGLCVIPVNIINDLSEIIGGKLLKNIKIIIGFIFAILAFHVFYYYTPNFCTTIFWNVGILFYTFVTFFIEYSTTSIIFVLLIGYISICAFFWKPSVNNRFHYASIAMWILLSCYLSNFGGNFQVSVFIALQIILISGFIFEVQFIQDELNKTGKNITVLEATILALKNENLALEISKVEEIDEQTSEKPEVNVENKIDSKNEMSDPKTVTKNPNNPWKLELFESNGNKKPEKSDPKIKEVIENSEAISEKEKIEPIKRDICKLKLQRSMSQPFSISQLNKLQRNVQPPLNNYFESCDNSNASDLYIYSLPWAICAMIFWKNISLLPLLPLPILIYMLKHVGFYLGLWQWLFLQIENLFKIISDWCNERFDALIPVPIRGLYRAMLKFNKTAKDNIKDSIDTVSSIFVILGLIVFVICASVFFAIQIYAETIKLVQTTGNVINSTIVHNPELRQLLPPSIEETLDSVLDNAYIYGREGISKLVRGMVHDADSVKTAKLEQQVLELWDRIYQAWMTTDNSTGPVVTADAVQISWEAFVHDIKKSPEMFNIKGLTEFVKQNIGTFMSVLESVWTILKGNFSIIVGSFSAIISILLGGGTAVLNFILNMIVFLTTLFYLLSSSGDIYKPVDLITNFSPNNSRLNRFGESLAGAVNGVFKVSLKMALFYGMWTWFIHNLFGVKIVYLPSALATILGAVPFLGTYWACIPAVLDLWLAQSCGFKAILLAMFQFLPTMVVDTAIYTEIKGGHPYLTGLAIAGGIFCLGFEGAIIGPLLLCGLYVVIDLSSSLFKETPSEEHAR